MNYFTTFLKQADRQILKYKFSFNSALKHLNATVAFYFICG